MVDEQEALKCAQDLIEQASHHYEVAYDCDCPPESTANWKHYKTNCQAAAMLRKMVAEREADRAAMRRALEALEAANAELHSIGDIAHDASTGPAVWDTYWNIRNAAYNAMDDAAITDLRQRLEGTT